MNSLKSFFIIIFTSILFVITGCSTVPSTDKNESIQQEESKEDSTQDIIAQYDEIYNQLNESAGTTLTPKEVQYNMANHLDEYFGILGIAELDDYYNYGWRDEEKNYFVISLQPYNTTSFKDRWYVYISRSTHEELYNSLLSEGKQIVYAKSIIDTYRYKDGQGNLAKGAVVVSFNK